MTSSYLRISHKHKHRARALGGECTDLAAHRSRALCDGLGIGRIAARGWVVDGLGRRSGVGVQNLVDDCAGRSVARACRCLASAEDVDLRTALARLQVDWRGEGTCQHGEDERF